MHPVALQARHGAAKALPGPVVVVSRNPFNPADREVRSAANGACLDDQRPDTALPVICSLNGEPVLAEDWPHIDLCSGDVAVFTILPQGGGDGGSSPVATLLAIAVTVAGVFTGNPYLIAAGFSLLAVGLIPVPTYTPIGAPTASSEQSPTYSIQLQGNAARVGQAIPVPYGYHIMTPDFASQPYSEFDANGDQYYHALFCLGMADALLLVNTFIDDTPLTHFVGVETQLAGPAFGGSITLVNPNVVNAPEVAQQDLLFGAVVGPFAASGPGLRCTSIGIDIICPRGLYYANDDGTLAPKSISWLVEARALTNTGAIAGVWFPLGVETLNLAENKAIRRSYLYNVPEGRYQVRMQRVSTRDDNTRAGHDIQWLAMRAYLTTEAPLDDAANYLAVKIKATSQLSGISQRRFSVILQRLLPTWNPTTGWSAPVATSSPAWALADVLRNELYGGKVGDNRIDLLTLYELSLLWAERNDTFNGIFDKRITVWNALATIARAGRARPIMRGSVFTFVRDTQQDLPVALFNMRNIARGSLIVDYSLWSENAADGVELEYFDARTWASDYVVLPVPGVVGEPANPAKMSIVGITSRKQAEREAAYYAAEAAYRRVAVSFVTEMEGFLPGYGDLIAVSHDVMGWGSSGEIIGWDGVSATTSEELVWGSGVYYMMLTNAQGDPQGPFRVDPGTAGPGTVRFIDGTPDINIELDKERTRYSFGEGDSFAMLCRVVGITPQEGDRVQISALVEDNRVHTADLPYAGSDGGTGGTGVRRARYAPDGIPNYDASSDAQRAAYGYYTRPDLTVGTANDPGYVYDNP